MTDETLVLIFGFASSTVASLFAAWKGEQAIRTIALRVKEETLQVALELATKTRRRDIRLNKKLDKTIDLTIIGNDIKADILKNQTRTDNHDSILKQIQEKTHHYRKESIEQLGRIEETGSETNGIVHELNKDK